MGHHRIGLLRTAGKLPSKDKTMGFMGRLLFGEDVRNLTAFYRDFLGWPPQDPQLFPEHRFFRILPPTIGT